MGGELCLILLKVVMTLSIHEFSFISRHNIIAYLCIEFLTDAIDDLPHHLYPDEFTHLFEHCACSYMFIHIYKGHSLNTVYWCFPSAYVD